MQKIKVKLHKNDPQWMPTKQTPGSAAFDLKARLDRPITLGPGEISVPIPTGVFLELPQGYEAQIRPRSGLAAKFGVSLPNSPGTIDSDYRGEIRIPLVIHKHLEESTYGYKKKNEGLVHIEPGMRIAQMVIQKLPEVELEAVETLTDTERGEGGFGSTGQ